MYDVTTVKNSDVIMVLENGRILERENNEKVIADRKKIISNTQDQLNCISKILI